MVCQTGNLLGMPVGVASQPMFHTMFVEIAAIVKPVGVPLESW